MNEARKLVIRPVVTEKAMKLRDLQNKYVFEVAKNANKIEIGKAIEEIFGVGVTQVRTISVHGKPRRFGRFEGRRPDRKKAIVTLKQGDRIELFEEV
jgi:large subunit ribosomal protein L23